VHRPLPPSYEAPDIPISALLFLSPGAIRQGGRRLRPFPPLSTHTRHPPLTGTSHTLDPKHTLPSLPLAPTSSSSSAPSPLASTRRRPPRPDSPAGGGVVGTAPCSLPPLSTTFTTRKERARAPPRPAPPGGYPGRQGQVVARLRAPLLPCTLATTHTHTQPCRPIHVPFNPAPPARLWRARDFVATTQRTGLAAPRTARPPRSGSPHYLGPHSVRWRRGAEAPRRQGSRPRVEPGHTRPGASRRPKHAHTQDRLSLLLPPSCSGGQPVPSRAHTVPREHVLALVHPHKLFAYANTAVPARFACRASPPTSSLR
jgi:hypothetical protein